MGRGYYSYDDATMRSITKGYASASVGAVFTQKTINSSMDPHSAVMREARDSEEHPNSLAIILGLDVTGSMGSIPHHLVKEGLPKIVSTIMQRGISDPQILFLGIGDHECDDFPLQVGQFESSDELMEKWLLDVFLEGGGGGNDGESYLLAWYFAANHTSIDCFEKRGEKGFVITIGDEPTLPSISKESLRKIMGSEQSQTVSAKSLLEKVREKYHVLHFHILQTRSGSRQSVIDDWKGYLDQDLITVKNHEELPVKIAEAILARTDTKNTDDSISENKEGVTVIL